MSSDSVTILAYHAIETGPGPICLDAHTFRRQIDALHEAGCVALTMEEVGRHLRAGTPFPDRAVALTFDDAYASVHRAALPVLAEVGWAATVFPVTAELGGYNRWDADRGRMPTLRLVSSTELVELLAAGWDLGSHTHSHRDLTSLDARTLGTELDRSTAMLEDLSQRPVGSFAYPFGRHDARVRAAAWRRYGTCLTIGARRARLGEDLDRIERVDAWYLQRSWQARLLPGHAGDVYLAVRRLARASGQALQRSA